jgi:hypothetical protein
LSKSKSQQVKGSEEKKSIENGPRKEVKMVDDERNSLHVPFLPILPSTPEILQNFYKESV